MSKESWRIEDLPHIFFSRFGHGIEQIHEEVFQIALAFDRKQIFKIVVFLQ